uniref:Uncharacterized protein n=1 Tax=Trepomonas sp. PC1 TaxID=1076344 RepID=A0A146K5Q4_9EUKA|eukprot:JAP92202.1 Hypothetical protein TPC1_15936 [Trepomonas sp. PC1]
MDFPLSHKRRRSILMPVVNPPENTKPDPWFAQFYNKLATFVSSQKLTAPIELLFILPRDTRAIEVIQKLYKKDVGIHEKLILLTLPDHCKRFNHFVAFLPRYILFQVNSESTDMFNVNSAFSSCFRQLLSTKKFNFDLHRNVQQLSKLIEENCIGEFKSQGYKIESTFYTVTFQQFEDGLKRMKVLYSAKE